MGAVGRVVRSDAPPLRSSSISAAVSASAQSDSAVRGLVVAAADGSVLGGCTVTLTSSSTGEALSAPTDATGWFAFPVVRPGEYRLSVSLDGFAARQLTLAVEPREVRTVTVSLEVAGVAVSVEVAGARPSTPGTHSPSSTTLTIERLEAMPVFQRTTLSDAIVTSAPGMIRGHDDFVHIRGHEVALNPLINGVSFWENTHAVFSAGLSPDVIETANVMTGGFPAEYGNRFGGVIDIVTRSGLRMENRGAVTVSARRRRTPARGRRSSAAVAAASAISCSERCSNRTAFSARPIAKPSMTTREARICFAQFEGSARSPGIDQGRRHGRRNEFRDPEDRTRRPAAAAGERAAGHAAADRDRRLDGGA